MYLNFTFVTEEFDLYMALAYEYFKKKFKSESFF